MRTHTPSGVSPESPQFHGKANCGDYGNAPLGVSEPIATLAAYAIAGGAAWYDPLHPHTIHVDATHDVIERFRPAFRAHKREILRLLRELHDLNEAADERAAIQAEAG